MVSGILKNDFRTFKIFKISLIFFLNFSFLFFLFQFSVIKLFYSLLYFFKLFSLFYILRWFWARSPEVRENGQLEMRLFPQLAAPRPIDFIILFELSIARTYQFLYSPGSIPVLNPHTSESTFFMSRLLNNILWFLKEENQKKSSKFRKCSHVNRK